MPEILKELGRTEGDVMVDEIGEYVLVEEDNGSPSEVGYINSLKKFYVRYIVTDSSLSV